MEKVFVCAGMGLAKDEEINRQAVELGEILASNNVMYVQGGTDQGLMGLTLNAFVAKSKNVKFIIPSQYYDYDAPKLKEIVGENDFCVEKVDSEAERLKKIKECDRVIVLPGGTGTLEELLYCNETARAGECLARIEVVNIDGFYDGFLAQVNKNIDEGFSKSSTIKFSVYDNVNQIEFANQMVKNCD